MANGNGRGNGNGNGNANGNGRTVSEVAAKLGVTVRTLHHYDAIGLVRPADRTDAGYRLYDDRDLARLHEILVWRALGFPLDEVRALVDDPTHDPLEALTLHRQRLVGQVGELNARIAALDEAIRKTVAGEPMGEVDLVALFDGFDPAVYEAEAEARWADTDAWRESKRRTSRYTAQDWRAMRAEAEAITHRLADLMRDAVPADAPEAIAAAEAHQAHITRWFYACTAEIHLGLGQMYVDDPRFAATYDKVAPGLAVYVRDAIEALHTERRPQDAPARLRRL